MSRYQEMIPPHSPSQAYPQQLGDHPGSQMPSYPPPFNPQHQSDLPDPHSPAYHSATSLPRYNSMYQPISNPGQPPLPPGTNTRYRQDSRYSSFSASQPAAAAPQQQQQHPLSNAFYADSSPTLQGSTDEFKSEKGHILPPLLGSGKDSYANGFKRLSGAFVNGKRVGQEDGAQAALVARKARLGYLDGLKFIAAWVVLNGTLFDAAVPNDAYRAVQRGSPLYVLRSTNLGIALLLLLSGRAVVEQLWDVPAAPPKDAAKSASAPPAPTVAWFRTARALLARPFRFILPVMVVAALQWGLAATGKTANCNNVGMDEPHWAAISNFAGYATLIFDLFTWFEIDTVSGQAFGANLWVTPWLFQGSYCAYVSHIMLGNLSSNRYWIYFALGTFSWFSFNFFTLSVIGVAVADMVVHGQFRRIQRWPFLLRLAVQLALVAIAAVTQFIGPIRDGLNSGMATVNVLNHTQIAFADVIFATCLLVVVETSTICQFVFGNVVMRLLGKLSAGLFLLAPAITFTVVPDLALSMHRSNSSPGAILGVSWAVLFLACFGLAIVFHFVVELPSKLAGEYFADFATHWGRADSTTEAIRDANRKAKSALKAPVEAPARLRKAIRS